MEPERFDGRFTDKLWYKICDLCMSDPVPLAQADLTKPFVYARQWGVFYVPGGYHPAVMSFLLAVQYGLDCGIDVAEKLDLRYSDGTADHWMKNTPGAAFKSSVSKTIQIASKRGLTVLERRLFGNSTSIFDSDHGF